MIKVEEVEMLNVEEISAMMTVSPQKIRALLKGNELRGKKIARKWHCSKDEVKRYLTETTQPQEQEVS